ncbi:MAG: hypothetical protein ACLSB9_28025 [Hydrogeniiclostridium mannosilyticum]
MAVASELEMILITENGEIYLTDGVAGSFVLDSYHSNSDNLILFGHNMKTVRCLEA